MKEIKFIVLHAKEYFNKQNGTTYFSVRITCYYENGTNVKMRVPLQNGYEEQYLQSALTPLCEVLGKQYKTFNQLKLDRGRHIYTVKETNCTRKEVQVWGE